MPFSVLIVDDDEAFRRVAAEVLGDRGYGVAGHAGTVAEARAAVARLRPDVVLLDVNLPDGNGIDFASELAADGGGPRVLLTSSDSAAVTTRLVERSGASAFVAKSELMAVDLDAHLG